MQHHDVVVVGDGVLGFSLAVALVRRELSVGLVTGGGRVAATRAAGAMLGCFGEVTASALQTELGWSKLKLARQAQDEWEPWRARLDSELPAPARLMTARGTFVLLNAAGAEGIDSANFEAIKTALAKHGEPFDEVDPGDLEWLDADANARPLRAMFLPNEHAVDATRLLASLEQSFRASGGSVLEGPAVRLDRKGDRVRGITLADGAPVSGNDVVLAAGVHTQSLLDQMPDLAGRMPRIVSGVGVSALLLADGESSPESVLRTPNRAFACGLHLVPRGAAIYVGATNTVRREAATAAPVGDVLFLLTCVTRQLRRSLTAASVAEVRVGNRPVSVDGVPLVGATSLSGLWILTGTYRDGLHLSPLLAEDLAKRLTGVHSELDIAAFTPERRPTQTRQRHDIINEAAAHMVGSGFEHEWTVPVEWPGIIERQLRTSFARFADELDDEYTPPPEVLAAARIDDELAAVLRAYYRS